MSYYRDLEEIFDEIESLNEEVKRKIKQANSYIDKLHNIISILQKTIKNLANKGDK